MADEEPTELDDDLQTRFNEPVLDSLLRPVSPSEATTLVDGGKATSSADSHWSRWWGNTIRT